MKHIIEYLKNCFNQPKINLNGILLSDNRTSETILIIGFIVLYFLFRACIG